MDLTFGEKMLTGTYAFLIGMGLVFLILILLIGLILLLSKATQIKRKEKAAPAPAAKPAPAPVAAPAPAAPVAVQDDAQVVAAIMAVICAMGQQEGKQFRLASFRRVGANTPAWNQAGRQDSIYSRFY